MERESFLFYRSFASVQSLPLKERDWIIWALINYALDGTEPDWNSAPNKAILQIIWSSWKPVVDANTRKRLAGKKGGAPKGSNNNPNGRRGNQEETNNEPETNQELTKNLANIKVKDKDKVKNKELIDAGASISDRVESEPKEDGKKMTGTKQVVDLWNEMVRKTGAALPLVVKLTDARKKKIQVRWKEFAELGDPAVVVTHLFKNACESKFFQGDNKSGWSGSFDWLFENNKNWVKTYEGNYDNKPDGSREGRQGRLHVTATSAKDYEEDF